MAGPGALSLLPVALPSQLPAHPSPSSSSPWAAPAGSTAGHGPAAQRDAGHAWQQLEVELAVDTALHGEQGVLQAQIS